MFQVYNAHSLYGGGAGDSRMGEGRKGPGTCLYHAMENYSSELGEGKEDSLCKNNSFKKVSNIQSNNTVSCSFLMEANTGWSDSVTSESPLPRRMDRPSSRAKTSEFWFWHECLTTSLGVENVLSHKLHL